MYSPELQAILDMMKPAPLQEEYNVEARRQRLEQFSKMVDIAPDIKTRPDMAGNIPVEYVISPNAAEDRLMIFLHGGSYVQGSLNTHRELASRLARASGMPVLQVDYRLAPEYPFPAAVEDAAAAYRWALAQGYQPEKVALCGDSAGGGLVLCALAALRDAKDVLPAAAACLSPWADLSASLEELTQRAKSDIMLLPESIVAQANLYLNGANARHPHISPVYASFKGFPPLLVQVGKNEMLFNDAKKIGENAKKDGVPVELEVWETGFHGWHAFAQIMPEGQQAIDKVGAFIKKHMAA